jgi:hypothetical protein
MYNLEIRKLESYSPTDMEQIVNFEQQINARLPQEYVQFLLQYNGGAPKKDVYKMLEVNENSNEDETISLFYTLAEDYNHNLFSKFNTFLGRMPKELIPIAIDPFGNQICLAVKGENYGKVYFWNHDWEHDEGEEPTYRNISLISNSFQEFVDKLYEYELED